MILPTQFKILPTQFMILPTQFMILPTQFMILPTQLHAGTITQLKKLNYIVTIKKWK